jgi:multiple sugar transport system ATP-binding protein
LLPDAHLPDGAVTIGARTEHLRISRSRNGSAIGTVDWIEHLGDQNHLHVKVAGHKITTLSSPVNDLRPGDCVAIELDKPLYFDTHGNRVER